MGAKAKQRAAKPKPKARKPAAAAPAKRKALPWWKRRRTWLILSILALLLAVAPFAEVLFVKYVSPPVTTLMLVRKVEGIFSDQYKGEIHYQWIPLNKVSPHFIHGVWCAEDERYFDHDGIDWKAVELSRREAERTGNPPRGASTITMQCARTVFLWQGRSWIRKGLEVGYTWIMEKNLSKRRILELYVNTIELGDGVYGIEAAAQHYYGKTAAQLSRNEAAMLAAMLPYPRGWNPKKPSPRLRGRYAMVLRKMRYSRFPAEKLGR